MSKILVSALSCFSAGIICGFIIGRATSPDSTKRETAERFVALYAEWKHLDSERGSLTLRAANRIYSYSTGDPTVSTSYLSALEMANNPAPTLRFDHDVEKLASLALATPATGIVWTLAKGMSNRSGLMVFKEEHQLTVIAVLIATVGGAALGYYLGHKSNPDYDNEIFQQTIHDSQLWTKVEADWRYAFTAAVLLKNPCRHAQPEPEPAPGSKIRVRRIIRPRDEVEQDKAVLKNVFAVHPEIEDQVDSQVQAEIESCQ